jgi:dephospho-CoA kinase
MIHQGKEIRSKVVGAVGLNGSGKDALIRYLGKRCGLTVLSLGDVARELAHLEGVTYTRGKLQEISQKYREKYGKNFFVKALIEEIDRKSLTKVGVSGIRTPTDVETLRQRFGSDFLLVHVDAGNPRIRFERLKQRGTARDPQNFEDFLVQEQTEKELFQVDIAIQGADVTVANDSTLEDFQHRIDRLISQHQGGTMSFVRWFESLGSQDVGVVGGKNASLGEMIGALKKEGIGVPDGFATTAEAYWKFLEANDLRERLKSQLDDLNSRNKPLHEVGRAIRSLFLHAEFPEDIARDIREAYRELCRKSGTEEVDVAVRSSATAEDLPEASFAGQQETFLNVTGEAELLEACRRCYASLFTDRAITYRKEHGFDDLKVALSVGVQKMVRSDKAGAGVMFTIDTETGLSRGGGHHRGLGFGGKRGPGHGQPRRIHGFQTASARKRFSEAHHRQGSGRQREKDGLCRGGDQGHQKYRHPQGRSARALSSVTRKSSSWPAGP